MIHKNVFIRYMIFYWWNNKVQILSLCTSMTVSWMVWVLTASSLLQLVHSTHNICVWFESSSILLVRFVCLSVCPSTLLSLEPFDLGSWNFACIIYTSYGRFLREKKSKKKIFPDFFRKFFSHFCRIFLIKRRPKEAKRRVAFKTNFRFLIRFPTD